MSAKRPLTPTFRKSRNVKRRPILKPPTSDIRSPTSAPGSALHSSFKYPCDREQDFAAYRRNVLALRKTTKGTTTKNGRPSGYEIAQKLFPTRPPLTSDL